MTHAHIRSHSPTTANGHTQTHPYKNTPSGPQWVTFSPNFIKTEKVKQNEKTDEFVSVNRTRDKL